MNPITTTLRVASLVLIAVAVLWLSSALTPRGYYPLRKGMRWDYEVSSSAAPSTVTLTVSNSGRRRVGQWDAAEQRVEVSGGSGYRYVVESSDSVTIVAEQFPGKTEVSLLDPPVTLLHLPLEVGKSWDSDATTTAIHPGTKIPVIGKVQSVSERVEVPAGRFDSSVLVQSSGQVQVADEGSDAPVEVRIETRLWYVKGVGVVQIERRESSDHPELGEVQVRYRLVDRTT